MQGPWVGVYPLQHLPLPGLQRDRNNHARTKLQGAMIARRLKSDEEYMQVVKGLIGQLQDAEAEVINLRQERDQAISKLSELTVELNRALDVVIRLQAGAKQ